MRGGAEVGHVGIGGDLEDGDAGGEHDQGAEKERGKEGANGGGQEEQGAGGHGEQADDHGALVAGDFDDLSGGQGKR